jgi:tetratricopeptide (TPR) repeat protein
MAVEAWQLYANGQTAEGLVRMSEATEREAATEKHPVSPGEIIPIAELYGDMLMDAKRPQDALVQYQKSLVRNPNRFNTLYGAGHAAELSGDKALAKTYYDTLLKVASAPKSSRTELAHARKHVSEM